MHSLPSGSRSLFRPERAARIAALLAAGVPTLLAGCTRPPAPQRPAVVLLISLDAFRADLLDERRADGSPQTPNLAELATHSRRFDDAFSPIAFTLPAHMSLLTGLAPGAHGVVHEGTALGAGVPTLASWLRQRGFRTAAIVNATWMQTKFGFDRGFDSYDVVRGLAGSAREVTDRALARLTAHPDTTAEHPLFLFLHYFEAHSDFPSQGTRLTYYSPPEYRQDLTVDDRDVCDEEGRCGTEMLAAADAERRSLPPAAISLQHELYRRGARFLDHELGRLFEGLRRTGLWRDAWIVVTADHGEEFREHGRFLHTQVYSECLRVPLLVHLGSRSESLRDRRLVSLEDVFPTLAARLGEPPVALSGIDLLDPARRGRAHTALLGRERGAERLYALRTPHRLLVKDFATGETRLFQIDRDPGETRDLSAARPREVGRLERRLAAELRGELGLAVAPAVGGDLDESERRELRSLGYL